MYIEFVNVAAVVVHRPFRDLEGVNDLTRRRAIGNIGNAFGQLSSIVELSSAIIRSEPTDASSLY